jgi:hypothetical protein
MEEFPSFHEIQMFQLSALRFIFREKTQADALSKVFHVQTSLALDHRYVLYSMDRKAGQESEGANLGGVSHPSMIDGSALDSSDSRTRGCAPIL